MPIQVSLNIAEDPAVTVSPATENVNEGNQTIEWEIASQQPAFTFVGVAFLSTTSPFEAPTFQGGSKMSVREFNNNSGIDYPYVIMVNLNGIDYCSVPSSALEGNPGGTPIIHNN
jgi:hypothetical protein